MDEYAGFVLEQKIKRTIEALHANRFQAYFVQNREAACELLRSMLPKDCVVSNGGSMTLAECGVFDLLRSGEYQFLDRSLPGMSADELGEVFRRSFFADWYLGSVNAVTEAGELFNIDGNGNRVAAYLYGPKNVAIVAGINKIVPDIDAALARGRRTAAPANVRRLEKKTPCYTTGRCMNCKSEERICCDYVVQSFQREPGRIKVILVGEELGY